MSRWFHAVTSIRSEIMSWTARQSKHAMPGWPLATLLTCLQVKHGHTQLCVQCLGASVAN